MKVLILYETYSAGTQAVAEELAALAQEKGHEVLMQKAREVEVSSVGGYDLVILGSPSWLQEGQDGQPHQYMIEFLGKLKGTSLAGKRFAVFGLGDRDFARFTHAVDIITKEVEATGAAAVIDPLRLDSFWFQENASRQKIKDWATTLFSS